MSDRSYTDVRNQIDPEPPRPMPCNVAAEQALLGALLCDNGGFSRIADMVRADDFFWGIHQRIFEAIGLSASWSLPGFRQTR